MARKRLARWSAAVLVACIGGTTARAGNSSSDIGIAGFYAVAHDVVWSGDRVLIDLTVQLINDSSRPVLHAAVAIERPGAPDDQIENAPE
jgi:hypothetical protein